MSAEEARVLAIDPGERRWGLAVSAPAGTMALPLAVRVRAGWKADLDYLRSLIDHHRVTEIVVGRPLTLEGAVGPQAEAADRLAQRLRAALQLPVHLVDERLTTAEAARLLREADVREREQRGRRDAMAAALILQSFLDRRRRPR